MRDGKGIAKNTAILYVRMLILLLISLYTTRVVLDALGVVDYGLYNVIGGVVVAIGFLTGTMNTASARFITVALGKGEKENVRLTFGNVLIVNILLALLVVIVCETLGLWFLHEKMVIPEKRMDSAFWVFQISTLSVALNIMAIPYNACIIAHERMKAFAYITLIDGVGKLVVAFALTQTENVDKLILYAALLALIHVLDQVIYVVYCGRNFFETHLKWKMDSGILTRMAKFISWAAYGSLVSIGFTQGLNILINLFFGPAINAARGISVQIQTYVSMFTNNFQMAINPRIMKSVAQDDFEETRQLLKLSSKLSFFLLSIVGVPLLFVVPQLLGLWLKEVPPHTVSFVRLMVIISIFSSVANPLRIINQAEGNIRKFQLCECTMLLMIVPVSWLFLKKYNIPELVYIVHLTIELIANWIRVWVVMPKVRMRWTYYLSKIYLPPVVALIATLALCLLANNLFLPSITGRLGMLLTSEAILLLFACLIGMDKEERHTAMAFIKSKIKSRT